MVPNDLPDAAEGLLAFRRDVAKCLEIMGHIAE